MKNLFLFLLLISNLLFAQTIHDAVKNNDFEQFKSLIESNSEFLTTTYQIDQHKNRHHVSWLPPKITPLFDSILHGRIKFVKHLIKKGVDLKKENHSIFLALLQKDESLKKLLIDNGAKIVNDTAPHLRANILTTAIWLYPDEHQVHKELIELGAGVNLDWGKNGNYTHTPLGMATRRMLPKAVKLLVENGATLNLRRNNGQIGLHDAIFYSHGSIKSTGYSPEALNTLLENGGDKLHKDNNGDIPLEYAAIEGVTEALKILWGDYYDVNTTNFDGMSLLHRTVIKGYYENVKFLISKGFDLNLKDNFGKTPIDYAYKYGHKKITALLESKGCKVSEKTKQEFQKNLIHKKLEEGQAICWYLGRWGFAVKTENNVFIFTGDWSEVVPDNPSIDNGTLTAKELSGKNIYFWGSQRELKTFIPSETHLINPSNDRTVNYFANSDFKSKHVNTIKLKNKENKKIGGVEVYKINNSNWLIESDGVKFLYSQYNPNYNEDILSKITGCDIALMKSPVAYTDIPSSGVKSVELNIRNIQPRMLLHHTIYSSYYFHSELSRLLKEKECVIELPVNRFPGDCFFYDKSKTEHLDKHFADIIPLKPGFDALNKIIETKGILEGKNECQEIINANEIKYYFFPEMLNSLGYQLIRQNKLDEAIQIFKWNVELFPENANPYDSLAETYLKNGQLKKALTNYEKAYSINKSAQVLEIINDLKSKL